MAATPIAVLVAFALPVIDVAAPAASNAPMTILDCTDISVTTLSNPAMTFLNPAKSAPVSTLIPSSMLSPNNKPPKNAVIPSPMAATPIAIPVAPPMPPFDANEPAAMIAPNETIASGDNSATISEKPFADFLIAPKSKSP